MTYDEALAIIEKEGEYSTRLGITKKLVIVPLNKNYFSKFTNDLNQKHLSMGDVKKYAEDNDFTIWQYDVHYIKGEVFKF